MSQDDIDQLLWALNNGSTDVPDTSSLTSHYSERAAKYAHEVTNAVKRFGMAVSCGPSVEDYNAELERLHHVGFTNWLYKHGFNTRQDYKDFVNKEAAKRGLKWRLK
jgi:hypothetical protein